MGVGSFRCWKDTLAKNFVDFISAEDPRSQIQELENELELQQQQIKDLQIKLESACKVQEMLTIRLQDELRARWVVTLADVTPSGFSFLILINIDYIMVGERVRLLYTSCEESQKNERIFEQVSLRFFTTSE